MARNLWAKMVVVPSGKYKFDTQVVPVSGDWRAVYHKDGELITYPVLAWAWVRYMDPDEPPEVVGVVAVDDVTATNFLTYARADQLDDPEFRTRWEAVAREANLARTRATDGKEG